MDLSTNYLGFKLEHPLMGGASPLSVVGDGVDNRSPKSRVGSATGRVTRKRVGVAVDWLKNRRVGTGVGRAIRRVGRMIGLVGVLVGRNIVRLPSGSGA